MIVDKLRQTLRFYTSHACRLNYTFGAASSGTTLLTRACITRTLQITVASGATLTAAASLAFQITLTTRTTLFTNIGTALYIFAIASTASWRAPFSLAFQITPSSTTSHITVISSAFNFTVSPWTAEGALCSRAFHVTISLLRRKKWKVRSDVYQKCF